MNKYCSKCHTELKRVGVDEVKNAFRDYVIYADWCSKCKRFIGHVCEFGGQNQAPKGECIMGPAEPPEITGDDSEYAPNCMEGEEGVLYWKCNHYIMERKLTKEEIEAGIV